MFDDDKEKIRAAVDFQQLVSERVQLTRKGSDLWGRCPFHHEKSASFHINPTTQLWKCFGCGKGGDMFAYVMLLENLSFGDALRYLADKYGIELTPRATHTSHVPSRTRLFACMQEAENYFVHTLLCDPRERVGEARAYLSHRGFDNELSKKWHIGYAPSDTGLIEHLRACGYTNQEMLACDIAVTTTWGIRSRFFNRVMFAIHDEHGKPIGFGGRVLGDEKPKYLNTKETALFHKGKNLFALDMAKDSITQTSMVIVCEGYTDVIAMHEHGFTNTVAALGTALTHEHMRLLERFSPQRAICMFDGDAAGQKAAERAIQFMDTTSMALMCVILPNGEDPAEYLSSHTPAELMHLIDNAEPLLSFVLAHRLARYDLRIAGQRIEALKDVSKLLSPLKHSLLLDDFVEQIADMLSLEKTRVKDEVMRASADRVSTDYTMKASHHVGFSTSEHSSEASDDFEHARAGILSTLNAEGQAQYKAEEELLCLVVEHPECLAKNKKSFAEIDWIDTTHEALAQSIIRAAQTYTASDLVAYLTSNIETAPQILSSGSMRLTSTMDTEARYAFLTRSITIAHLSLRIQQIKARLRTQRASLSYQEAQALLEEATRTQKHVNNLKNELFSAS